ncbi:Small ribosomal subunit protein uS7y [Orobanche gracilis]
MATEEVVVAPAAEGEKVQSGINLFNRWSYDEIQIVDISVQDYITATAAQHPTYMPHTAGRYQAKRFRKAQYPICNIR